MTVKAVASIGKNRRELPYAYEMGGYAVVIERGDADDYVWRVYAPLVWGNRTFGKRAFDTPEAEDAEAMGRQSDVHAAMDAANVWIMEQQ